MLRTPVYVARLIPFLLPHRDSRALYNETALQGRLPERWLRRGRFWLVSQVLHFLTTPNSALKQKLRAARESLGTMRPPVLALHVRKGDACSDRDECHSLSDYLPVVRRMITTYGYRTVFLATPDPTVLDELRGLSTSIDFRFLPT